MARIKITDLPLLQDLTEEQLNELFGAGPRSYKPSFEALEDRRLMSGFTSVVRDTNVPAFDAAIYQTSAPVVSNVNQPVQLIPVDILQTQTVPYTILNQNITVVPFNSEQTTAHAADLFNSFNQPTTLGVLSYNYKAEANYDIGQRVTHLGASLGKALDDAPLSADNGYSWYQNFAGGKEIVWSPDTGPRLVTGLIRDRYNSMNSKGLGTLWGFPKTDDVVYLNGLPGDVRVVNDFTLRGGKGIASIVWCSKTADVGPQVIMGGAIWSAWVEAGAVRYSVPLGGDYGLPDGGRAQNFVSRAKNSAGDVIDYHQTITWDKDNGTRNVSGNIWAKWAALKDYGSAVNSQDIAFVGGAETNIHFQDFKFSKYSGWFGTITSDNSTGETHEVHGAIWQKWQDLKTFSWGTPISDETWLDGGKVRFNDFLARDGKTVSRLTWYQSTGEVLIRTNVRPYTQTQSLAGASMNLAPQSLGFSDAGAIGSTTVAATGSFDYTVANQTTTDATWADYTLTPYASAFSQASFWDSIGTAIYSTVAVPDIGPAPETGLSQDVEPASPLTPDQLQARLVELDHAISQTQQDLQGALDSQAQYTTEGQQIEADIQAATDLSSDETAPNLADLQASQVQNATDLEQNQQQISQLQTQLDLFTTEQGLIGNTLATADAAQASQVADVAQADQRTDFTGVTFSLTSLDTGDVHQLQIQDQSNYLPAVDAVRQQYPAGVVGPVRREVPGAAQPTITINVLWDGTSQATGTLSRDDAGNVLIRFNWDSVETGTLHTFSGTITGAPGSYHMDATDIVRGGGESDAMAGDQITHVADFSNVTFALSEEDGTAHQLQITDQTFQPDGTATFNGVWDGQIVTGTLGNNAAGIVHMTFIVDNGTFDANITGNPGAFQIDGNITMLGSNTSLPVAGTQIA